MSDAAGVNEGAHITTRHSDWKNLAGEQYKTIRNEVDTDDVRRIWCATDDNIKKRCLKLGNYADDEITRVRAQPHDDITDNSQ